MDCLNVPNARFLMDNIPGYMAMPSCRPTKKSMRMAGGALKCHQKQNRKKLPKSTQNSPQKVIQNQTALSSVQVSIILPFFKNLRHPNAQKFKIIRFST